MTYAEKPLKSILVTGLKPPWFADDQADEAKAELVMRTMLESGYGMIFVWAYEFEALAHYFAKQHPDVFFEIATGRSTAKNVSTYSARFYEGRYSPAFLPR